MAIKFVKAKVKDVSELGSEQLVTAEVVDEFAELAAKVDKKLSKIAPLQKALDSMEKGILGAVDEVVDEAQEITLTGNAHELLLGPKGQRTSITDMPLAVDMLGEELFLKLAKITMKDLQAYLTPEQLEQVTAKKRVTKRRVKIETL